MITKYTFLYPIHTRFQAIIHCYYINFVRLLRETKLIISCDGEMFTL